MAEVVGLAASIIAVVDLAEAVVRLCKSYIDGVKDAPNDLRLILVETSTLKGLLDSITLLKDTPVLVQHHDLLSAQIGQVQEVLAGIESLLGECELKKPGSKRQIVAQSLATLAWPLKKPRIMQRLDDLAKCKSTINLILLADTSQDIKDIKQDLREIRDKLSDDERQKILDKLIVVNPLPNHRQACHLHEPHTSSWITRSEEWKAWLHGDSRLLWIHGIPGAGKTILASFMIEQVKSFCQESSPSGICGWSFYYCHHSRSEHTGETAPFLSWVIHQISEQAQYVPLGVEKACRSGNIAISSDLVAAMAVLARRFEKIYIVIDALDECQHRPSFLSLLQHIHSSPLLGNLRLLVTSRDELDIRRAMTPISTSLSMTNPLVDEDIRMYIQNQVHSDAKFVRWPQKLLREVEDALADGAKGMFRWAACQLEILRRLNTASAIRKALVDLPETLDETYERILCGIPKESKQLAFRALSLVCATTYHPFTSTTLLAEAVRWANLTSNGPDDELLEVDAIYEFCVCLLTKTVGGTVTLAHYTVKEFLSSSRIATGPAWEYFLSEDSITRLYLETVFNRLLWTESPDYDTNGDTSAIDFLLYCATAIDFGLESEFISNDESLYAGICRFLHPSGGHLSNLYSILGPSLADTLDGFSSLSDRIGMADGGSGEMIARLCLLGADKVANKYLCHLDEAELAVLVETIVPFKQSNYTLLEIAALTESVSLTHTLILKSRKPIDGSRTVLLLLDWMESDISLLGVVSKEAKSLFKMVLEFGANPNAPLPITPLQRAVRLSQEEPVAWLLEAGADPNAVGDESLPLWDQYRNNYDYIPRDERGKKPLDICRGLDFEDIKSHRQIKDLLIQYGAVAAEPEGLDVKDE